MSARVAVPTVALVLGGIDDTDTHRCTSALNGIFARIDVADVHRDPTAAVPPILVPAENPRVAPLPNSVSCTDPVTGPFIRTRVDGDGASTVSMLDTVKPCALRCKIVAMQMSGTGPDLIAGNRKVRDESARHIEASALVPLTRAAVDGFDIGPREAEAAITVTLTPLVLAELARTIDDALAPSYVIASVSDPPAFGTPRIDTVSVCAMSKPGLLRAHTADSDSHRVACDAVPPMQTLGDVDCTTPNPPPNTVTLDPPVAGTFHVGAYDAIISPPYVNARVSVARCRSP